MSFSIDTSITEIGERVKNEESSLHKKNGFGQARTTWFFACFFVLLACIGSSWFSYQYFLVPQAQSFEPDWRNAQWLQPSDGSTPVAYFRYVTNMENVPDGAFLTIAANQTFRIYVNTTFIGTNETDFMRGDARRPYIYDFTSALKRGTNVIVIRVDDLDQKSPLLRANLHVIVGSSSYDSGTNTHWKATTRSTLVYPRYTKSPIPWSQATFDASGWPSARITRNMMVWSSLTINPHLYEKALSKTWLSVGAGSQAYFVRTFLLTKPVSNVWLRFAAAGSANIFVNGSQIVNWTGIPPSSQNIVGSLGYLQSSVKIRSRLAAGVYDIAPYLHMGSNTLAVYVSSPNIKGLLDHLTASMSMDIFLIDSIGHDSWNNTFNNWRVSANFAAGWEQGKQTAQNWTVPVTFMRPASHTVLYLPDSSALLLRSNSLRSTQMIPIALIITVIFDSSIAVLGLWLFMSLTLGRRYDGITSNVFLVTSLTYLPALACELLLITLTREPRIPQPFPYTALWGIILVTLVLITYLLFWINAIRTTETKHKQAPTQQSQRRSRVARSLYLPILLLPLLTPGVTVGSTTELSYKQRIQKRLLAWLRRHWALLPLLLVAIALISTTLTYEPMWQDELVSFYVSKNSITHGFPMMPSGFVYPKAELFDYILGLIMLVFGDQGVVPRIVSALEFIASIPLLYFIGSYFFGRYISWIATAMLALSPFALTWGAQVRMYEQAQISVLIMFYIFHKAALAPQNTRLPYIAITSLIITYLSHEETFIVLPGLVLCVLLCSKKRGHLLPTICYQKHWWFAIITGICMLCAQLLIVKLSHPPILGTDQSMRPSLQLNEDGLSFYIHLLFFPKLSSSWLVINSLLALSGCIWAVHSKSSNLRYCVLLLVSATAMLSFVFTMQADRYFYLMLPLYYLIGAYVLFKTLQHIWLFAQSHMQQMLTKDRKEKQTLPWSIHWLARITASLICLCALIAPMLPLSNYNLGVSRLSGLSYYHHFVDYNNAGQYIRQHWQKGDIIISVSPDIEMYYYAGRSDYYFSIDRALFLIERDGHIVNTATAAIALFNQKDFQAVLSKHGRIWLVSDHSQYEIAVLRRFTFPPDFHIVYEGARGVVYLRGS